MRQFLFASVLAIALMPANGASAQSFYTDTLKTDKGPVRITMVGHGTLMLEFDGRVIHVDPWTRLADYTRMPKADLILVTHGHRDHFDPEAIRLLRGPRTRIVVPARRAVGLENPMVMANGDTVESMGIAIFAVPAYNMVHMRQDGSPYHLKGDGNGYVLTLGGRRIYVAGDTENTPEMKALKGIDAAFLPANLPYTMSTEMVADAACAFKPKVLYPYHYGVENPAVVAKYLKEDLEKLMADEPVVEVRFPILKQ